MAVHTLAPRTIADVVADVSADPDPFIDSCRCPGADWDGDDWEDAYGRAWYVAFRNGVAEPHRDATSHANRAKLTADAHAGLHVPRGGRKPADTPMRRLRLLLRGRADDPDRVLRSP